MIGCGVVFAVLIIILLMVFSYGRKNYNRMVELNEEVKSKWSQVENQYQRRYDLIPNLVQTVKGYASHEKETFQSIAEARAKAGGVFNISKDVLNDPATFQKFQKVQNTLGQALHRLMVVQERYPELKADKNFLALQDQLEGTENRISVERKRFNDTAKLFNVFIKRFPQVMFAKMMGFEETQYFKSSAGADEAPKVQF
ncbi:MAG: LemA family protein [Candidatus Cloacimonadota bacterium]|nr:LemA family protein [Candidatus Cloacimonadota bacterium]